MCSEGLDSCENFAEYSGQRYGFSSVRVHLCPETAYGVKRFIASLASVRFLATMRESVPREACGPCEIFLAFSADVRFLAAVDVFMFLKASLLPETLGGGPNKKTFCPPRWYANAV